MANENDKQRLLLQDARRRQDVELKHDRIREFLEAHQADGLLLQDPANIAWVTAGANTDRCVSEGCRTSVFLTADARLFATNSVDSPQIFEREAFGLGFQLKQRDWHQSHEELLQDLCRGRTVLTDAWLPDATMAAESIRDLRLPLTDLECRRLRRLARVVVHAVEATGRRLRPGMKEAEIAGEIAHRLIKRTVTPAAIQVCADGRNARYRHWAYGEDEVRHFAVLSCVARRWGLHAVATRTICFNTVPEELQTALQQAALIQGTGIFFSRPGRTIGDVWPKVRRIYEKFGIPGEWQLADQGDVIGYSSSESRICPTSAFEISSPIPIAWRASVGPALFGDTILAREERIERLTWSEHWPHWTVQVKRQDVPVAAPLVLERNGEDPPAAVDETVVDGLNEELDASDERFDSVWEMSLTGSGSVLDEDETTYPSDSVLE